MLIEYLAVLCNEESLRIKDLRVVAAEAVVKGGKNGL